MTTSSLRHIVATVCSAIVALSPGACSDNDPEPPRSNLTLSTSAAGETPTRVTLTCEPTGGEHVNAEAACAALAAVGGDFDRITGDPGAVCVQVYEPVEAAATGTWQGRNVDWRKVFGNKCELSARTTPVF
ncbi:subtilisin inhibitor-like [Nocardia tenerifensis]|uniref:Subtilisin inhibitor-like n=1 Tax=Nocardia tenerifensis TaxID=228006 RepID=A0A318JSC2_9NOCA|nr:SSI family serine proteinase inhibitor [Nocardia tenerifensis]PXX57894.1 subtilisin inhibitor-like [Nocardia tenerifensis]